MPGWPDAISSSRLYLATRSPREVGDEGVGSLAGTVGDELGVSGVPADGHGLERLGHGADLVDLDQRGIGDAGRDGRADDFGVGDEDVVADELDPVPEAPG